MVCVALFCTQGWGGALTDAEIQLIFMQALDDASVALPTELDSNLISITPDNNELVWNADKSKVLVVTWKSQQSYDSTIKNGTSTSSNEDWVIWVTTAPQVQKLGHRYLKGHPDATKNNVDLRVKQYLGLRPEWGYDVFVEMWARPENIIRPCMDPEITDKTCGLEFKKTLAKVKNIENYQNFYKNLYFQDFHTRTGGPWTGMGYTYDWGNPDSEVGASEFILVPSTPYEIKQAVPTMDYFNDRVQR